MSPVRDVFEELIGNKQAMRIFEFLMDHSPNSYSKSEIINHLGMGRKTLYENWLVLEKYNLIRPLNSTAKWRYFVLNKESTVVKLLLKINVEIMRADVATGAAVSEGTTPTRGNE